MCGFGAGATWSCGSREDGWERQGGGKIGAGRGRLGAAGEGYCRADECAPEKSRSHGYTLGRSIGFRMERATMVTDEIERVLTFLRAAERLKIVMRSGWTSEGQQESVAEHTWRLCLMAVLLYGRTPGIDLARLLKMCLIHDLGEAIGGDVPAPAQQADKSKAGQERRDLLQLIAPLPLDLRGEIVELWDDYEAAGSVEAKVAKGLDKLETILQHNQGKNPADFDYTFNLDYGARYTSADPVLTAVRESLDQDTARNAEKQKDRPEQQQKFPRKDRT